MVPVSGWIFLQKRQNHRSSPAIIKPEASTIPHLRRVNSHGNRNQQATVTRRKVSIRMRGDDDLPVLRLFENRLMSEYSCRPVGCCPDRRPIPAGLFSRPRWDARCGGRRRDRLPRLADEQSPAFQQANDLPDSPPFFRVEGANQFIARLSGYGLCKDQDCGLRSR